MRTGVFRALFLLLIATQALAREPRPTGC
ncbi:MAG: hypothetical protein JWN02_245, partial [Acidobacteria bacterium]|nr:hypothetical protein [Acidobacteriota bacterium]